MIKDAIRQTPVYDILYKIKMNQRNRRVLQDWQANGQPLPPPHILKQLTIKEYGRRFRLDTLVETGTYYGDMIYAVKDSFKKIYSIELSEQLASISRKRLSKYSNIEIIQGDSVNILPKLLSLINQPCLMWLDAHYSGGETAKGRLDTPIMQELEIIFQNPQNKSCVLIDDARCFDGKNAYPLLEELESYIKQFRPDWAFELAHDIIRVHPK
jgi:hypothetical protein